MHRCADKYDRMIREFGRVDAERVIGELERAKAGAPEGRCRELEEAIEWMRMRYDTPKGDFGEEVQVDGDAVSG